MTQRGHGGPGGCLLRPFYVLGALVMRLNGLGQFGQFKHIAIAYFLFFTRTGNLYPYIGVLNVAGGIAHQFFVLGAYLAR